MVERGINTSLYPPLSVMVLDRSGGVGEGGVGGAVSLGLTKVNHENYVGKIDGLYILSEFVNWNLQSYVESYKIGRGVKGFSNFFFLF